MRPRFPIGGLGRRMDLGKTVSFVCGEEMIEKVGHIVDENLIYLHHKSENLDLPSELYAQRLEDYITFETAIHGLLRQARRGKVIL